MNDIKIPLYNLEEFKIRTFFKKGNGGTKYIAKNRDGLKLIFKPDAVFQGVNEYLAQLLIEYLGLPHLYVVWLHHNDFYCVATKFIDDLTLIYDRDLASLNDEQKETVTKLIAFNSLVGNDDNYEFYLTPSGQVITMDFGMAMVNTDRLQDIISTRESFKEKFLKLFELSDDERFTINYNLFNSKYDHYKRLLGLDDDYSFDAFTGEIINSLSEMDISIFSNFLDEVNKYFGKVTRDHYEEWIINLKKDCLEHRGGITEEYLNQW